MTDSNRALLDALASDEKGVLDEWLALQLSADTRRADLIDDAELREQSRRFLAGLVQGLRSGAGGSPAEWSGVREVLLELGRTRARQGFSPAENATFLFSLKQPLFARLRRAFKNDPDALADATWSTTVLLDAIGLVMVELHLHSREEVVRRQQQELLELSTPVVRLWNDILALPLIGALDSTRAQIVMESLLQQIVEAGASIAIIDITGVPTVDTLVAQHLLKTVAAARLMGADCIISGIRPQIAQTIVQLGVALGDVTTKATLADAFAVALRRTGQAIVSPPTRA